MKRSVGSLGTFQQRESSSPASALGAPSISNRTRLLTPTRSTGPGMYIVSCGPTAGQYLQQIRHYQASGSTNMDFQSASVLEAGRLCMT